MIGSSPPSAPSKAYTVVGGRTHERPVDGPYITYNEAINETTIILKWTVSDCSHMMVMYKIKYLFFQLYFKTTSNFPYSWVESVTS